MRFANSITLNVMSGRKRRWGVEREREGENDRETDRNCGFFTGSFSEQSPGP
jgi:hypothetical protein